MQCAPHEIVVKLSEYSTVNGMAREYIYYLERITCPALLFFYSVILFRLLFRIFLFYFRSFRCGLCIFHDFLTNNNNQTGIQDNVQKIYTHQILAEACKILSLLLLLLWFFFYWNDLKIYLTFAQRMIKFVNQITKWHITWNLNGFLIKT